MDGLRRTSAEAQINGPVVAMPQPVVVFASVKPKLKAPALAARPAEGVRYVTGMDGIRRPVAMPTPLEVIANNRAIEVVADEQVEAEEVAAQAPPVPRLEWRSRPVIVFSLIAAAVVATGATAYVVNSSRPTTASAASEQAPAQQVAEKPAAAVVPAVDQRQVQLQQLLNQFAAGQTGGQHFNIVVKDLGTGMVASVNPDQPYASASLYKLFVAQQIYRMIDTGQLTYTQSAGGGSGNNVIGCLNYMITVSDNTCGRALGSLLNWNAQDSALANAGYTGTTLATPQQTNAHDVALLFERLYERTLNSPNANDAFLTLLKGQKVNNRLPVGLPGGTVIAHKTGDLDDVVHDAGIVYGPKTNYLVVAMSGGWKASGDAPAQFNTLSQQLWNFFEQ